MSGNCATGMRRSEIAPASVIRMAITIASRGRAMKICEIIGPRFTIIAHGPRDQFSACESALSAAPKDAILAAHAILLGTATEHVAILHE